MLKFRADLKLAISAIIKPKCPIADIALVISISSAADDKKISIVVAIENAHVWKTCAQEFYEDQEREFEQLCCAIDECYRGSTFCSNSTIACQTVLLIQYSKSYQICWTIQTISVKPKI